MRNPITRALALQLAGSAYMYDSALFLCTSELRKYVDLPPRAPRAMELILTNEKPRGSNYHVFKWSKAQREWTMRGVKGGSPGFYYAFTGYMNRTFKKSHTVYAWIKA